MATVEMSRRDARRVALAAQGFADKRPTGRVDSRHFRRVLDRLATVQIDSVNVITRSHELVFFARLGPYDRTALNRWLWESRQVFEYWGHEASLHPVARHPLLRWRMAGDHPWGGVRTSARDNPEMVESALVEIAARGPVSIGDAATGATYVFRVDGRTSVTFDEAREELAQIAQGLAQQGAQAWISLILEEAEVNPRFGSDVSGGSGQPTVDAPAAPLQPQMDLGGMLGTTPEAPVPEGDGHAH